MLHMPCSCVDCAARAVCITDIRTAHRQLQRCTGCQHRAVTNQRRSPHPDVQLAVNTVAAGAGTTSAPAGGSRSCDCNCVLQIHGRPGAPHVDDRRRAAAVVGSYCWSRQCRHQLGHHRHREYRKHRSDAPNVHWAQHALADLPPVPPSSQCSRRCETHPPPTALASPPGRSRRPRRGARSVASPRRALAVALLGCCPPAANFTPPPTPKLHTPLHTPPSPTQAIFQTAVLRRPPTAQAYGSYGELLADPEIHCVYIPLPTSLHLEVRVRVVLLVVHLLLPRPFRIVRALRPAGSRWAVGCQGGGSWKARAGREACRDWAGRPRGNGGCVQRKRRAGALMPPPPPTPHRTHL